MISPIPTVNCYMFCFVYRTTYSLEVLEAGVKHYSMGIVAVVPQADSRGDMRLVKDLRESMKLSRLMIDGLQ